jgi:hypothetical protein
VLKEVLKDLPVQVKATFLQNFTVQGIVPLTARDVGEMFEGHGVARDDMK